MKELGSLNLDFATSVCFFFETLYASEQAKASDIGYSKGYFSSYYCVDLETFNKWVRVFCPEVWDNNYKKKRKFTQEEARCLFENLGRVTYRKMPPQSRKDLLKELYQDKSLKKSQGYKEISLDLKGRYPDQGMRLNKLPPKIVVEILTEEIENYQNHITEEVDERFRAKIHAVQNTLLKYQRFTDYDREVCRRFLRRWLSKEDIE